MFQIDSISVLHRDWQLSVNVKFRRKISEFNPKVKQLNLLPNLYQIKRISSKCFSTTIIALLLIEIELNFMNVLTTLVVKPNELKKS